jgi:hypothetical protein
MVLRATRKFTNRDGSLRRFHARTRPGCEGIAGCHADGTLMSNPADKAMREIRHQAHLVFDSLWMTGLISRNDAYRKLATFMGMLAPRRYVPSVGASPTARCPEPTRRNAGLTTLGDPGSCGDSDWWKADNFVSA